MSYGLVLYENEITQSPLKREVFSCEHTISDMNVSLNWCIMRGIICRIKEFSIEMWNKSKGL
jgi:hypothetical protein